MRNILVFPDSTEVHFQYPKDHKIEVGYKFQLTLKDNTHVEKAITSIVQHESEPEIRYFLEA